MARGFAALDEQIRRLRSVRGLAREAAPEVAAEARAEMEKQIAAGQTPGGQSWQPTADGGRPLRHAAESLTVTAVGTTIVMRLTGRHALHHRGQTRGNVRRQILPSRNLNEPLVRATKTVLGRRFGEIMGVRRGG